MRKNPPRSHFNVRNAAKELARELSAITEGARLTPHRLAKLKAAALAAAVTADHALAA